MIQGRVRTGVEQSHHGGIRSGDRQLERRLVEDELVVGRTELYGCPKCSGERRDWAAPVPERDSSRAPLGARSAAPREKEDERDVLHGLLSLGDVIHSCDAESERVIPLDE